MMDTVEVLINREIYSKGKFLIVSAQSSQERSLSVKWNRAEFSLLPGHNYRLHGQFGDHEKYGKQFDVDSAFPIGRDHARDILSAMYLFRYDKGLSKYEMEKRARHAVESRPNFFQTELQKAKTGDISIVNELIKEFRASGELSDKKVDLARLGHLNQLAAVWHVIMGFSSREMELLCQYSVGTKIFDMISPQVMLTERNVWKYLRPFGMSIEPVDRLALGIGIKPYDSERVMHHMDHAILSLASSKHHILHPFLSLGVAENESVWNNTIKTLESAFRDLVHDDYGDHVHDLDKLVRDHYQQACERGIVIEFPPLQINKPDQEEIRIPRYCSSGQLIRQEVKIMRTCGAGGEREIVPELQVRDAVTSFNWKLTEEQIEGVVKAFRGASVVTGGPGTGKTTMLRGVRSAMDSLGLEVVPLAPTGKAARRLAQQIQIPARTVHKEWASREQLSDSDLPKFFIVDEMSMVSLEILMMVLDCMQAREARGVLFVGDVNQLPPVGIGAPFRDMIQYLEPYFPITRLTRVFRQEGGGEEIAQAAQAILHGDIPECHGGFEFIELDQDEEIMNKVGALLMESMDLEDPYHGFQVMSARRTGNYTVQQINDQHVHNCNMMASTFQERDKVMMLENNYDLDIMNGEIGCVVDSTASKISIQFEKSDRETEISTSQSRLLDRAWAITIHKCQGSEYDDVVIPIFADHINMWTEMPALLYTAVSRGKRRVKIVASRESFHRACRAGSKARDTVRTTAWYLDQAGELGRVMKGELFTDVMNDITTRFQQSNPPRTRRRPS